MFIKKGGKLLDCHPITDIIPGDIVVLKSSKGDIKAKKIIITVGKMPNIFNICMFALVQ